MDYTIENLVVKAETGAAEALEWWRVAVEVRLRSRFPSKLAIAPPPLFKLAAINKKKRKKRRDKNRKTKS